MFLLIIDDNLIFEIFLETFIFTYLNFNKIIKAVNKLYNLYQNIDSLFIYIIKFMYLNKSKSITNFYNFKVNYL